MNDCSRADMRDLLPDLLHERLDPLTRAEVERHVAACSDCAAELRVLRGMRSALARTPAVDVARIAESIRDSRGGAPVVADRSAGAPRRRPVPALLWKAAAGLALIASGAAGLAVWRATSEPRSGGTVEVAQTPRPPATVPAESSATGSIPIIDSARPSASPAGTARRADRGIVFGGGVGDLADADLEALMEDLRTVDGLTEVEPQPVLPVIGEGA